MRLASSPLPPPPFRTPDLVSLPLASFNLLLLCNPLLTLLLPVLHHSFPYLPLLPPSPLSHCGTPPCAWPFTLAAHCTSFWVAPVCEYSEPSAPRRSSKTRRGAAPRCGARCAWGTSGERGGPQVPRCLPARDPRERSASPSPGGGPFFTSPDGAFLPSQLAGALATPPECAPGDKPPARSWNPPLRGQAPAAFIKREGEKLSLAKFSIAFCSLFIPKESRELPCTVALTVDISRSAF